jgi:hypothetical protein
VQLAVAVGLAGAFVLLAFLVMLKAAMRRLGG